MGLKDMLDGGPVRNRLSNLFSSEPSETDIEQLTIAELKQEFGEEAVKRGVSYMASLSDADERYRDSADGSEYERRYVEGLGADPDETEVSSAEEWEEGVQKNGLGLDS